MKYPTFRYHDEAEFTRIYLSDSVDNWSRFALRNTSGTPATGEVQFGKQDWGGRTWGYARSGRYALNGRMGSILWWQDNSFNGELFL